MEELRLVKVLRVHPHLHLEIGRGEVFVNKDIGSRIVICLPTRQIAGRPDLTVVVKMLVRFPDPVKTSAMSTSAIPGLVSLQKQEKSIEFRVLNSRRSHFHEVSKVPFRLRSRWDGNIMRMMLLKRLVKRM